MIGPWAVFGLRWYYWGSKVTEHRLVIRKRYVQHIDGPFTRHDGDVYYVVSDVALQLLRTYLKNGRLPTRES